MNLQLALIVFAIIFIVIWLKLRKKRPSPVKRNAPIHNAVKIAVPVEKGTPTACLLKEGKLYGESFHNKVPPQLPCCENCRCKKEDFFFKSSGIFEQKNTELKFETGLGLLPFLEYKYLKYSLLLHNNDMNETELKNFEEIRKELKVSDDFKAKVKEYLEADEAGSSAEV